MAIGAAVTLSAFLPVVIGGIGLVTLGFFVAHAVASGRAGRCAGAEKGHAASFYLLSHYLGSSLTGWAAGWVWQDAGWPGVVVLCAALSIGATALA